MVFRGKLFHHGAFGESHVVFVGRNDFMRILLRGLLDHGEERRRHFFAVDDKRAAENLVSAVFRVDLGEAKHFRVGQLTSQLLLHAVEVFDFRR